MAYTLIRGRFHIHYADDPRGGPQPDGDTIKFEPDNPALVEALRRRGSGPDFNRRGFVNIRLEAVDALETHFSGYHQPLGLANAARDAMLRAAGYTEFEFHEGAPTVSRAVPPSPPGYLLSRTLDQHGRIVGFVFAGDPEEPDGSHLCLRASRVHQSVNASLLADGLVYPSFYDTLPSDLRETMAGIAFAAREAGRGLWPSTEGTPQRPATIRGTADVEAAVLFPKLFRRLARYFASGAPNLNAFIEWLREQPGERDDHLVLPSMELANLHDIISIDGDRIWMTVPSDAFVIIDTPETWRSSLEQPGCEAQPRPASTAADLRIVAALPNPAGTDLGNETVTILNTRADPIDLAQYRIQDSDGDSGLVLHGVLAGGDALRVRLNAEVRLGNRGDTIRLVSPAGEVVDEVSYSEDQAASGRSVAFGRT